MQAGGLRLLRIICLWFISHALQNFLDLYGGGLGHVVYEGLSVFNNDISLRV